MNRLSEKKFSGKALSAKRLSVKRFSGKTTLKISLISAILLSGCAQQTPVAQRVEPVTPSLEKPQPEIVVTPQRKAVAAVQAKSEKKRPSKKTKIQPATANDASIWPRIRNGMRLTAHSHPRLEKQLDWYANNHTYIDRVLARGNPYLYYIVSELEQRNMPLELALLPVVESAFDPFAYSHSHAAGLWQFIPGTGERFGLEKNWWYDGRRDPVASTQAAMAYLSYLHRYFDGDWLLALAAYNSGEGNVRRAIRRNKKLGKPTDFWSLELPKETRAYVPQLLAVSAIVREPKKFNTRLPKIANRPYFDKVEIGDQADLTRLAALAGIDKDALYRLNAGYKRQVTDPQSQRNIFMPISAMATFKRNFAAAPKSEWAATTEYIVKKGDNLSTIAQRHDVSVKQLKRANRLQHNGLKIGQRLKLPGTGLASKPVTKKRQYVVTPGDSLWSIARKYQVSVKDLQKWNRINAKATLQPGQTLAIDKAESKAPPAKKLRYKVRRGDSLHLIASKFDLKVSQIVRWNKLNPKRYLQPGQRLTLFVDIANI